VISSIALVIDLQSEILDVFRRPNRFSLSWLRHRNLLRTIMQWNGRDNILKYVRILLSKARNTTTGLRQMIQKRTVEMLQAISLQSTSQQIRFDINPIPARTKLPHEQLYQPLPSVRSPPCQLEGGPPEWRCRRGTCQTRQCMVPS